MIKNVPKAKDLEKQGLNYLNLAWSIAAGILLDRRRAEEEVPAEKPDQARRSYIRKAGFELNTCTSLTTQEAELLLKSKLCEVSPWLLILTRMSVRDLKQNSDFSDLRTIDAQDLFKAHNTFCKSPISNVFDRFFERLRHSRNQHTHGVNKPGLQLEKPFLLDVLEVSEHLLGPQKWAEIRSLYIDTDRIAQNDWGDQETRHPFEMQRVIELLSRKERSRFFGIPESGALICPGCYSTITHTIGESEGDIRRARTARLESNGIVCCVCAAKFETHKRWCTECRKKTQQDDDHQCLVCCTNNPE